MKMVKCCITGEIGDINNFIKADGKFYKSQEIYNEYMNDKGYRVKINKIINGEFLDKDIRIGAYIGKRLKNIKIDGSILYMIFEENLPLFRNKLPNITGNTCKVNYIFRVIEEQISRN